jgi:hypothetical protein
VNRHRRRAASVVATVLAVVALRWAGEEAARASNLEPGDTLPNRVTLHLG